MPRVSIGTLDRAVATPPPAGIDGPVEAHAYFNGERDPIHLHVLRVREGSALRLDAGDVDRLAYVWEGTVEAGGRLLDKGSSFIVEHGAALDVAAGDADAAIVIFWGNRPRTTTLAGGHVRLLPRERVPRIPPNASGTSGALHSDGSCGTSALWLNENSLGGRADAPSPQEAQRGIHAHPEDEIIFVTEGQVRLGAKLYDRGTAIAVAANTLYGFSPGPDGVSFITFRSGPADTIRFAAGGDFVESTYFSGIKGIDYLEPVGA
ncbi:MAG: hypothetical protein ABW184_16675 [Sphingobium sp.]